MEMFPILERIGLTKNESKIYVDLLTLGQTTTGDIISKTKIHNSKVYDGLNRLIDKGLVTYVLKNNVKYFSAVDPERLIDFLDEKKRQIDEEKEEAEKIIPELQLKMKKEIENAKAEIFVGWKGMETIYGKMLRTLREGDENLVLGASKGEDEEKVRRFFNRQGTRLMNAKVKQRIIFNESARGNLEVYEKNTNYFEQRFMENTTPTEINIWGDFVLVVILKHEPLVVAIEDRQTADSFREYFEVMWKAAKK